MHQSPFNVFTDTIVAAGNLLFCGMPVFLEIILQNMPKCTQDTKQPKAIMKYREI